MVAWALATRALPRPSRRRHALVALAWVIVVCTVSADLAKNASGVPNKPLNATRGAIPHALASVITPPSSTDAEIGDDDRTNAGLITQTAALVARPIAVAALDSDASPTTEALEFGNNPTVVISSAAVAIAPLLAALLAASAEFHAPSAKKAPPSLESPGTAGDEGGEKEEPFVIVAATAVVRSSTAPASAAAGVALATLLPNRGRLVVRGFGEEDPGVDGLKATTLVDNLQPAASSSVAGLDAGTAGQGVPKSVAPLPASDPRPIRHPLWRSVRGQGGGDSANPLRVHQHHLSPRPILVSVSLSTLFVIAVYLPCS